jgi:hypothetical protein
LLGIKNCSSCPTADLPSYERKLHKRPFLPVPTGLARFPSFALAFRLLNANIARQFEFVQNTWLISTHFRRRCRESAPEEYQAAASAILERRTVTAGLHYTRGTD